jgi:hypothetical protein
MRQIGKRFTCNFGPFSLLAVVTTVSVMLNTDVFAPPRFDGAGYAILGEALTTGRGYREINEPASPRHDHFPPGYPVALALLWRFSGRSIVAAHAFSAFCTVGGVLLAWRWFHTFYPPRSAFILGLALGLNWTWGRVGGSIQSEPFYIFCEILTVLLVAKFGHRDGTGIGIMLGVILAATILIRHIGVCLVAAVAIDLGLRTRWKTLRLAGLTTVVLILPWAGWLTLVHRHTQVGLFTTKELAGRIVGQAIFYLQRLPDQVVGPFVEVGTVLRPSPVVAIVANCWAAITTGMIVWGWIRMLRTPRRRLAAIIAFITLSLLLLWPFTEAGRFLVPLVPFVLVGLAEGLAHALTCLGLRRSRDWAVVIVLTVSVPYTAYSIMNNRAGAQRRLHADFDTACQWIARHATHPGPVLTRHPGEVFWQTGHLAIEPDSANPEAIDRLIDRLDVAYLLIDEDRYVNATSSPLKRYVERYPERVTFMWGGRYGMASIQIFESRRSR